MNAFFKSRALCGGVLFFFLFFLAGDIVPQGNPGNLSFAELLDQGKKLYAEKDYENAVFRLLQAHALAKTDADKIDLYSILSQVYFDFEEPEAARNYMKKMVELAPEKTIAEPDVSKGYWKLFQEVKKAVREASPQVAANRYGARIKKRRRINKIELIGAIVLLVGAIVVFKLIEKGKKIKVEPDYDTQVMKIEWVTVPAGEFQMGDNFGDGDANERPVHAVYLDKYEISKFEITYEQYDLFCKESKRAGTANPQETVRGSRPVLTDRWSDAFDFCYWLSEKTGKKIHLLSEAQWEKAARGTDQRRYPWGNAEPSCGLANFNNCASGTQPVGSCPAGASPYGVMDMAGNVMEWCQDVYDASYYSSSPGANPTGPLVSSVNSQSIRVARGGKSNSVAFDIRVMKRYGFAGYDNLGISSGIGFRICKE
jgi:formylglycine-generating enzyme